MRQLSLSILLFFITFNLFSQVKNQIVEVVLYRVSDTANLNFITKEVNQEIANFDGFISRQVFQSFKDENLLLDWVVWESLEKAEKAAQELPQKESLVPFMQSITKVESFEHFEIKYFAGEKENFDKNAVLELVLYKIKKEKLSDFELVFNQVSDELKNVAGFQKRQTGVSFKENNKFVDFLIWENLEKAQKSMEAVEKNPKILPFFEMNEETFTFEHFKPLN